MKEKDVLVVGAVRSPIGSGRKDSPLLPLKPQDLALQVLNNLFDKTKLPREAVTHFKLGSVVSLKSEKVLQAPAREIALRAQMFNASSNIAEKACSSGLLAIAQAMKAVRYGEAEVAIGGGLDMMSNAPEGAASGALTDPLTGKNMAQLSDLKARELGFSREDYDRYAFESYRRASEHLFSYSGFMEPVFIPCQETFCLTYDQNVRYKEMTAERMEKAKSLPECEITTPYNSSKLGDGCGLLMLASPRAVKKYKLPVLAKIHSFAEHTLREPKDFIIAPVGAVYAALEFAKISPRNVGAWWINEAFSGSPLSFMNARKGTNEEIPYADLNPWGGAIAHGHPLGATGAILSVNAICQAQKENKKYFVVSLCNAIAEATAMTFERL